MLSAAPLHRPCTRVLTFENVRQNELDAVREEMGVDDDSLLTGEHMQEVVRRFKSIYAAQGVELPADVNKQLELAVAKVF